ncbi:MAG: HlyD family secretion protein [Duodenibacillus sp.]|nr:HlyD family secretion protein [Duodenibacillus sp.]
MAIFSDKASLIGRPVRAGERIMDVAPAHDTELLVWLSTEDAMPLPDKAPVKVFLNIDPDRALEAEITRASFVATPLPEGYMAYRLEARFTGESAGRQPRVGLRGVAKVYGEKTTLGMLLFRRPVNTLRQTFGL